MPCWRSSARCGKRSRIYNIIAKSTLLTQTVYERIMHHPLLLPRFLTDLELACKTKSFDVHKLVISSVSQYFREILAKDPGMKRLELPSLSPLGTPLTSVSFESAVLFFITNLTNLTILSPFVCLFVYHLSPIPPCTVFCL